METTCDGLLNRRVTIEQPAKGYRVAVDTVLLAAAVPAHADDKVLELGCGVGGTMLCLAARVPDISITGVEIQPELVELCRANIAHNGFDDRLNVSEGDATNQFPFSGFDHVMINPPYHGEAQHDVSPNDMKRVANTSTGDLDKWIASAAHALKSSGTLILIHRADCLDDILIKLESTFGGAEVLPILPRDNALPKRVILRAYKGKTGLHKMVQPLILHKVEGGYTDEAETILRHAKPLEFR
jgi:tRNA1(Val) A37 N6-methylase TrmN6